MRSLFRGAVFGRGGIPSAAPKPIQTAAARAADNAPQALLDAARDPEIVLMETLVNRLLTQEQQIRSLRFDLDLISRRVVVLTEHAGLTPAEASKLWNQRDG